MDDDCCIYPISVIMKNGQENVQPHVHCKLDDVYTFSYTSGTTSEPKGAMLTHRNILAMVKSTVPMAQMSGELRYVSYLPLAHVYERVLMNYILYVRGKYGIFAGDVFKLDEDLAAMKPTLFCSVPRLFNKFYDGIKKKTKELTGMKKTLYEKGLKKKLANVKSDGSVTSFIYDKLIFSKFKQRVGGHVELMLTASAPIDLGVLEFLKVHFCCPIMEAYGQTEGSGGEFTSGRYDPVMGHVGGPTFCNEFMLRDVAEMSYTSKDIDENGQLRPRGEICVRGPNVIPGYYKNDEKTKETIDEDGWLMSGDIGMILPGSNALKIFDRKKNIFKLSQGEYVAPEK